jgi:hypothetical protein
MHRLHQGIDRLHAALITLTSPRVFRHGTASPLLSSHVDAVQLDLPPLHAAQRYRCTARTLVGPLEAGYQVRWGPRPDLPALIYHHGIAEMPYDKSFRCIFRRHTPLEAHLVAIRAPFHRSWLTVRAGLSTLSHFMAMCAVSIQLMEAVRRLLSESGARGSLVAGTSLGGFLALMHHLMLGTADCYVPLLAGPDLSHAMLETPFHRFLASQARQQPAAIRRLLDFRQAFQSSDTRRVFPLLALYDLDMSYAYHHACYTASGVPVVTLRRGHITGSTAFAALRHHVQTCLKPLVQAAQSRHHPEETVWPRP